ncbi:MAG: BACON domain-containing protein [Bacteroidales bacterium]|nr:BACON domain-containing protein [Bacteroidales bacterium]MBR5861708.1 BACON domain-containing protein [Bacteroidales bacterium]
MKNIYRSFLIVAAFLAVSCNLDGLGDNSVPQFPESKEYSVAPGATLDISFSANMDWELSVPENSLQWFWIQDGTFKLYRIKGKAGDQTVTIGVSATEEFNMERSCDVTLKMGGKEQVIAKLVRSSKDQTLTLYAAVVTDGEIQFMEDGSGYLYEESEAQKLELVWTGSDFRLPVQVDANYNWTVKTPVWAQIDVPESGVGLTSFNIMGVPSEYPLEAAEGKVQFMAGDKLVKEYAVSIPGCVDIFSYKMDMGISEFIFNYAGQIRVSTGFIEGPASGYVSGAPGVRVLALGSDGTAYSAEAPAWLSVEVDAYDTAEGAEVLQERRFTVSTVLNEGDNRYAALFFLPPTVSASASELFDAEGVKEEYKQYMVPVTQLSSDQEFVAMLSNPSTMAEAGASFNISPDSSLKTAFGETKYAYELLYTNQYARDEARMMFTSAVSSYKVFDQTKNEMTDSEDFFLSCTLNEDMMGGVIDMVAETKSFGYVVFYGASKNVLAVIRCTLDPEKVIGEVADVAFIGESEIYAPMVGATLENVYDVLEFSRYKEGNALLYHLKYTQENMPMTISIPASVKKHTVNPYALRHNFSVNETKYDETFVNGVIGGVSLIDGGVTIYMLPDGKDYIRGNIIFTNGSDETILVLVCTFDAR